MSTHFILQISFVKCIFTNAFPVFKNSRDGKNISLVLFLPLKLWKRLPKIYKSVCGFFLKTHLATINLSMQLIDIYIKSI
jgi:hypothetical protein